MRFSGRISTFAGLLLVGACCVGCGIAGGTPSSSLVTVKGKVTFKGQPLTKGVVTFEPSDFGRAASGRLQSDGTYVLSTFKDGDGVVRGHHRVSITQVDKKIAGDKGFKSYVNSPGAPLEADVTPDKTEINFEIP
jgi:hypothetical protein